MRLPLVPNYKLAVNVCLEKDVFGSSADQDSSDITLLYMIWYDMICDLIWYDMI